MQTAFEGIPPFCVVMDEEAAIARATAILEKRLKARDSLAGPDVVKNFLRFQTAGLEHEVFNVLFLNAQNHAIEFEQMFRGTLTQTSVYPREVVKRALVLNAASVIFHHNHPSGTVQPSRADEALTQTLKAALALVDIRVLDHIITCDTESFSMAERGLL